MSSLIGRTLGQYEIVDVLGRGGMATVYLGRQASIDRYVAVKVLPPHPALDDAFKERFQLEAKTIGSLQNPNILPLYDYGTFEDVLYLVMQYVEGGTLEDLIEMGPMDIIQTERIVRSIASGLDFAHRKGVIHRDIKPGNILIDNGHTLLADFGMVKMVSGDSNLTGTSIVGTPSYMAPEQGQGLEVGKGVDIYALGAMAFEMLTGQRPFNGSTPMQMILAHINDEVPDIRDLRPDLSEELALVIRQSLAKTPENRYQSAGEFAEAFSSATHSNDDTLADVRSQFPISKDDSSQLKKSDIDATINFNSPITNSSNPNITGQVPTQIIVRDRVNPLVLMGGFGLMALVIVIVAVVLINNGNNNANGAIPTEIAIANTTAPTDVPVVVVPPQETFGSVRFSTENDFGDRMEVRLRGVAPVGGDNSYAAWLMNSETGETLAIGRVIVDGLGEGTATYTDDEGRMLVAIYNTVLITLETEIGESPTGEVVYSGALPLAVSNGLQEIFVASEDGINDGSLLDGAQAEARTAAQHAGLAAGASNVGGLRTHAEHTINILRGGQEDYDGSGSGSNPGRGIGIFFFMDAIDTILSDVTSADGATPELQSNAEFIRVCTQNVRGWSEQVVNFEIEMITGETLDAVLDQTTESTALAGQLSTGSDFNENGIVEAFEEECGLNQIPDFGLQFARMDIIEGNVVSE